MNLTHDPWIPAIGADGRKRMHSLQELFAAAHEILDLSVRPHEKIALLRLLICITQAALDGPKNFDAWETCRDELQPAVKRYLEKWQPAFELFGDGPRFLQVAGLKAAKEEGEGNPATKLDISLSSGNTATIFDNEAGAERAIQHGQLALTLITYQTMSPCGIIGEAKWLDSTIPKCTAKHAPGAAGSMLHAYLRGDSLLATIHLNLLNKEEASDLGPKGWGHPVWEKPIASAGDKEAVANATGSYLGRLAALSRAVRLDDEGRRIILANGLDYPLYPIFREPAATLVRRKDGPAVLGVMLGRSFWRQLSAITVKRHAASDPISGPLVLNNLDDSRGASLWIAALSTDKAKIEDVAEAAYDIPSGMFRDAGRKLYEEGVALADAWQNAVWRSVKGYATKLKLEPPPHERARQHFWTAIERRVPDLLKLSDKPEEAGDLKSSTWGMRTREAAFASFEFACAHQTPRQIEAYSIGLQRLFLPKPKDANVAAKTNPKSSKQS